MGADAQYEAPTWFATFLVLLDTYLEGSITAERFAVDFLDRWREQRDAGEFLGAAQDIVDRVFAAVDLFEPDAALRGPHGLSADRLRQEVKEARDRLEEHR